VKLLVAWTTGWSVCLSVVYGKTADWIWMLFGMMGWLGSEMRHIVWIGDSPTGRGNFGRECVASHSNQLGLCGIIV